MNYKKIAKEILNEFFKNEKIYYQHIDGGTLIAFKGCLIVNVPDVNNPFNVGFFEAANLERLIDQAKENCEAGYFSGNIRLAGKKLIYEIRTTSGRCMWIDAKLFNQLDIEEPVFYMSMKTDKGLILIEDSRANLPDVCAAVCPVRI